jgi:hypothetical protein
MDGVSNDGPLVPHYSDPIISSLKNAHLVIEALGPDTVDDLMAEIVQTQLLAYDRMGREGGALFKLEKESFERRYSPSHTHLPNHIHLSLPTHLLPLTSFFFLYVPLDGLVFVVYSTLLTVV